MSMVSKPVNTSFFDFDISPNRSTRSSMTVAMPTVDSVVEKGCGATTASPPVRALNSVDLPALGRPTIPRRSMSASGYRSGMVLRLSEEMDHEQEDQEASAPRPAEEGQPRQASVGRPPLIVTP